MRPEKQSGRTSRQMQALPIGSVYVWCNNISTRYAVLLAQSLGRDDLQITTPQGFLASHRHWIKAPGADYDHATRVHLGPERFDQFLRVFETVYPREAANV